MADDARGQLREQMGPEFDDIDWQQFDPRAVRPAPDRARGAARRPTTTRTAGRRSTGQSGAAARPGRPTPSTPTPPDGADADLDGRRDLDGVVGAERCAVSDRRG